MRIISQERTVVVSYENGSLSMSCEKYEDVERARIYYYSSSCQRGTLLAEYTSKAKAIKAMKMLRGAYLSRMGLDGGYDAVSGCYVQPNYWVSPKVFRFPKDEEIEVEDENML